MKTRGGILSREAQQAIPQLVASAVDGLRPENVTVVDAETAMSFLSRRGPSGRGSFDSDEELAAAAMHAIEPVVGAEHVRASVHVDYDLAAAKIPPRSTIRRRLRRSRNSITEELAGGTNPAGVPGVSSNYRPVLPPLLRQLFPRLFRQSLARQGHLAGLRWQCCGR